MCSIHVVQLVTWDFVLQKSVPSSAFSVTFVEHCSSQQVKWLSLLNFQILLLKSPPTKNLPANFTLPIVIVGLVRLMEKSIAAFWGTLSSVFRCRTFHHLIWNQCFLIQAKTNFLVFQTPFPLFRLSSRERCKAAAADQSSFKVIPFP